VKEVYEVGENNPVFVIVPPGVVHAYQNIGAADAFVLNFPDRLYAGRGRKEPVDEIRYEDVESEFQL
jgi:dTDP-4-dehydrorhamnose 3,5-epimerase